MASRVKNAGAQGSSPARNQLTDKVLKQHSNLSDNPQAAAAEESKSAISSNRSRSYCESDGDDSNMADNVFRSNKKE
jgi:hypothetical protein